MTPNELIILAISGVGAGIVGGMFGVGGGIVVVPILVFALGLTQHAAQGTSIGMMLLPIGILAAWNYWKDGSLNWKFALVLAVTFVLGAWLGSKISLGTNELMLKRIFGVFMMVVAVKLIFFSK